MNDSADHEHLMLAARTLVTSRLGRARSRAAVRAKLDAMAAEARRCLGEVFTANDPVTDLPVALVVRSDERLPDDYEKQTPRPPTDTVSRLIIEVIGRSLTIEVMDSGATSAGGDLDGVPLDGVTDVRVAADARTWLVVGAEDPHNRSEIPFVRVLAALIDAAAHDEARFATAPAEPARDVPLASADDQRAVDTDTAA